MGFLAYPMFLKLRGVQLNKSRLETMPHIKLIVVKNVSMNYIYSFSLVHDIILIPV